MRDLEELRVERKVIRGTLKFKVAHQSGKVHPKPRLYKSHVDSGSKAVATLKNGWRAAKRYNSVNTRKLSRERQQRHFHNSEPRLQASPLSKLHNTSTTTQVYLDS
jgi:hypothetical protein